MKKLIIIAGLLLATNGHAHDELFPACPSPHKAHQVETEGTIKPPIAIYKEAPDYPMREMSKGKNGSVILEFTVNKEGKVSNPTAIGFTSAAFSVAAKQAAKKFLYEPAIDTKSNLPVEYQVKHKFTFEMESAPSGMFYDSDILDFDAEEFSRNLYRIENLPKKKAIQKLNSYLEEADNEFEKAVLLFQRAGKKKDSKPPDIKGMKTDLDSTLTLLEQLNQFDPNVIWLQAYVINALSGAYLDQRDDYKAVLLLRHFLEKTWSNSLVNPKQGYLANVNLGIAAFNLGDFCVSYHSFDRAVNAGSKLKIKNNKLVEYRDLAKEKI